MFNNRHSQNSLTYYKVTTYYKVKKDLNILISFLEEKNGETQQTSAGIYHKHNNKIYLVRNCIRLPRRIHYTQYYRIFLYKDIWGKVYRASLKLIELHHNPLKPLVPLDEIQTVDATF